MKANLLSRRMFLQGIGKTLPIPFLASMMPRELWAQPTAPIRRYIAVVNNYDYGNHRNWFPSLDQPALSMASQNGDRTLRYAPLRNYLPTTTSPLSAVFGNHLNPYVNQINLLRGMDISTRVGHGQGQMLGNLAANDGHDSQLQVPHTRTIDQVLRDNARFNPINRDVAVLGNFRNTSWRRAGTLIQAAPIVADDQQAAFNYFFNNGSLPESTGGTTTTPAHPRRDVLTAVLEDYNRVRNGRQISAEDRISLDSAFDKISDIQRSLAAGSTVTTGACRYKTIPTAGNGYSFFNSNLTMRAYADIITAAIMCDVARVIVFSCALDDGFYDTSPDQSFHHGVSHLPFTSINGKPNHQYLGEIQNQFVRNFMAPLLGGLAAANDPANSRSYLYNSLVHYSMESGQQHGFNSMPCFLAGNAGGNISSGYYLDYTDRARPHRWVADAHSPTATDPTFANEYWGLPYNRVFNTILQGMGLAPADYEDAALNTAFQNISNGSIGVNNNNIASMGGYGCWGSLRSNVEAYDAAMWTGRHAGYDLRFFRNTVPLPATSVT